MSKGCWLVFLLYMSCYVSATTVRVYFSLNIQTDPSASELSIKTGPLLEWEYLGMSPHSMNLFRNFHSRDFVKERPWHGGQTMYYSERYGYNYAYASVDDLFNKLRRDFGDEVIKDLGVVTSGWLLAETDGCEHAVRAISLNGNILSASFNQSTAKLTPNVLFIPLKEMNFNERYRDWIATVKITSDPSNCAVYCNEEYVGQTPCVVSVKWKSERDRREIRIEKSGFITNRRMITPKEERIHVVLQPMY